MYFDPAANTCGRLPVGVLTVPNDDDDHNLPVVMDFIDDPIVAHSNTPCLAACELATAIRTWLFSQSLHGGEDPLLQGSRQSLEFLFSRP